MHINIVTLFPDWFTSPLNTALLGKAKTSRLIQTHLINPRDWTLDRHKKVDDRPYGGGPGMIMMLDPIVRSLNYISEQSQGHGRIIMLSASGKPFTQKFAHELAKEKTLTIICGRYEGIDYRLSELFPIESIRVGEAVINGGEAAAMMLIEATSRLLPGFIGKETSYTEESFSNNLLEYPQYTRPELYESISVPKVLLEGNHQKIKQWQRKQSLKVTFNTCPEMLNKANLSTSDMEFFCNNIKELARLNLGRNLHCVLLHYPVMLGDQTIGATSLTNLDVHDIARCAKTYGLGSVTIVTPLQDQQNILEKIITHWTVGAGGKSNPDRAEAFKLVNIASDLQSSLDTIENYTGQSPLLIGTTACKYGVLLPCDVKEMLLQQPIALLFGTGHGLTPDTLNSCFGVLRPLRWIDNYNHLPVRSAVAITLDRILGDFY
ncbi:tRNA (guanosine(37)-N1)-methyltransferase TrmD [Lawsonia intracellularis]|nr:tRNA (guanosine(37)-N1)-methyltransferase TrmD [Lawsonia intracellularis]AGC49626.1 tRNA-(guanine-N1)-methyltransferase [Lawsonia intracellularis N343]KAA0205132.1 tRNA (guanine(37)-N(1))-methyltransferase [Lawsonia intracellularis]MBZ3892340.1 tRNA (guanosine(37)-N1)-methyltransferase TrmD [Lawsonia intracellularis]OMQ05961.1 tRNA (guanine(37)-N(1))-methyltransferase [Lawsonia intracellularis]RBN32321.1 tRNA (guanosine(37)-N1)-methyltransferase TrmD [Lawsonia intracellularis]